MSHPRPVLHMMCGKIASGKSTLTAKLGAAEATVVIAEDAWLSALYPGEVTSVADFVRCTGRIRQVVGPHVASLLNAGVSVVLDFQANTVEARQWMRGILDQTGADHQLHHLDVPEAVCLERLRARNAASDHPFAATEAQFHQISKHFVPPQLDEGFNIVLHRITADK
ncbi:AAA family ATPase [Flavimaricola marinus]|uniref:Zeta toxin n=1 Tax=Flavimaricola marinus TaxID=1819565 RepID=A0A238LFK8_9RHOB|nr:ATP-binding protein [Flavimaricola marinus]SMY08363.1 hypothetical protein LOM8899_02514 [Flavimaricola marinus]